MAPNPHKSKKKCNDTLVDEKYETAREPEQKDTASSVSLQCSKLSRQNTATPSKNARSTSPTLGRGHIPQRQQRVPRTDTTVSPIVRGVARAAAASPFLFLLFFAARVLVVARVLASLPVALLALSATVPTLATFAVFVTAAALSGRPRSRPVLLLLLFLRLVGRRGPAAGPGVGALRRRGRARQVELRERRYELLVVAALFGARAAHVQDDVLVRVHLEEVAALVGEVARVAALLARGPHGVRRLVRETGHHFAKRALHGESRWC